MYKIQYDEHTPIEMQAASLAAIANKVRGTSFARVRIWGESGLLLVDTKFGDLYDLVKPNKRTIPVREIIPARKINHLRDLQEFYEEMKRDMQP